MGAKIWAHRGASGYAPENTLEAFELAIRQGADGVELDVHMSADGQLIVTHDETIERVSDGHGMIARMTLAELRHFTFNRTHPQYRDARVPTLREVFALMKPAGLMVNVELKTGYVRYPGIERACIDLAKEMGMTERVYYSSFNHHSLLTVKAMDASLPCGLLYDATMVRPWDYARALGMDALHPEFHELLEADEVPACRALGIKIHTWTVNDAEDIRWVLDAGADAVITNYPDRAKALCDGN